MEQSQIYYERAGYVVSAAVALSILDIAVVMLRFWIRKSRHQGLKTDDWLILPATILTVAIGASMIYGVTQEALGCRTKVPLVFAEDPFDITTDQLTTTSKIEFAYAILLPLTLGFVKSSFLFFYMRIFSIHRKSPTNIFLVGLIVFVVLWAITFSLARVLGCGLDVEAHWGSARDRVTKCRGSTTVLLVLCITDFAADLAIIIIPVKLVWGLNLSTRNKVAVCAVFLLGLVTVAASLVRLIIEGRAVAIGFTPGSDSIFVSTGCVYWGFVECAVAILSACLPTLHGFVSHHMIMAWPKRLVRSRSKDEFPSPAKLAGTNKIPQAPITPTRLATFGTDSVCTDSTQSCIV
ncbi:hypothetical protein F4680DRAFT_73495 [Xylaria scruposa]|nr:hypothetical protein F4680DRAFT_73495 [Xylaria scruposa]